MKEDIPFLQSQLRRSAADFIDIIRSLSREDFERNPMGKWSAGQDLNHLVKTLGVILMGFRIPMWVSRFIFPRARRPSKSYADFSNRYREKMSVAHQAPSYVLPKRVEWNNKEKMLADLKRVTEGFCSRLDSISESKLDGIAAPHPLFGKVTLREMVMAAWLHTDHHTALLRKKLERE